MSMGRFLGKIKDRITSVQYNYRIIGVLEGVVWKINFAQVGGGPYKTFIFACLPENRKDNKMRKNESGQKLPSDSGKMKKK